MAVNGDSVLFLAQELFRPLNASLDYLFYAGALYGARHVLTFVGDCMRGLRTYFIPFGRCCRSDLAKEFGKWAGGYPSIAVTLEEMSFFVCVLITMVTTLCVVFPDSHHWCNFRNWIGVCT